jgi:hypothetical protein
LAVEVGEPAFKMAEIAEHGAHLMGKGAVRFCGPVADVFELHGVEEIAEPAEGGRWPWDR